MAFLPHKFFSLKVTALGLLLHTATILLAGAGICFMIDRVLLPPVVFSTIIVVLSLLKCAYFTGISYHKILEVSLRDTAYYEFILFMAMNISVVILSFATDFFCLLQVNPYAIKGIPPFISAFEQMFNCFYFSVLNFSFFGYGDIIPASIPAKIVMMFETLLSFMAVILVLSDFISLKNSIYEYNKKRKPNA